MKILGTRLSAIWIFLAVVISSFRISSPYLYAQQESSNEEEAFYVAQKAFSDGFYDVSLGLLERFLKNYPASSKIQQANLLIGECYFHQGKFPEALDRFSGLLNQPQAKDIEDALYFWIAETEFRGNNFSQAAEYYQKIISDFPKSSYAGISYYSLGWCFFQGKQYDKALDNFRVVETRFTGQNFSSDAGFKIIECLYNLKEYGALKDKVKKYIKRFPKDTQKNPYLYFYLAEADYYTQDFSAAIQDYSRALAATADAKMQALLYLGQGWSYLKLKEYKEAENSLQQASPDALELVAQNSLLLAKAVLKSETKSFTEAKNIYAQLIKVSTDPVVISQAFLGQADAFYNMADYQQAEESYKQALLKTQSLVAQEIVDKLHYGLAWVYLKEGKFKEAIDEFRKIAKASDDNIVKVSALCQIGDAYQDFGDFNKAIETYENILKNYPDSFYGDYVQYQLGLALLKVSNYEAAILAFETVKANYPNSQLKSDASYALGLAYFQRQDYNASKEAFEKFKEDFNNSPLRPQAMYLLGSSLYNLEKFPEAVEVFKGISRQYGHDQELAQKCEYEIADCYYRMGNEKEAMSRFNMLRSKYPDSTLAPEVMWWLGEYYYRHSNLDMARRYFSSLIRDFPKSNLIPDAYYALAGTYVDENRYIEAVGNFKKVIELGRSDLAGTAAVAIADIYFKQGKLEEALRMYEDVLGLYRNLENVVYPKMAESYFKMSRFDDALNYYKKSLDVVPVREMSGVQFKIAETLQAKGDLSAAIGEYLKVSYLYSENEALTVKALLRVGAIYEDKDNFKEALNIYEKISGMNIEEAKFTRERIDWIRGHKDK